MGATDLGSPRRGRQRPLVRHRHEKAEWRIPDTFMKMNRSHTVPLSKQALRVLQIMEPVSRHRPWVFPSIRKPLEHMHQQTANAALIRMGFGGELVAHGMRSRRDRRRRSFSP